MNETTLVNPKEKNRLIVKIDEDGRMSTYLPNGEPVYGEVFCRVTDVVREPPYAIIKCYVKLEK